MRFGIALQDTLHRSSYNFGTCYLLRPHNLPCILQPRTCQDTHHRHGLCGKIENTNEACNDWRKMETKTSMEMLGLHVGFKRQLTLWGCTECTDCRLIPFRRIWYESIHFGTQRCCTFRTASPQMMHHRTPSCTRLPPSHRHSISQIRPCAPVQG
jgi:hypothetical protein